MYRDSAAPLNLKNRVWPRMAAATTCAVQLVTVAARPGIMVSIGSSPSGSGVHVRGDGGAMAPQQRPEIGEASGGHAALAVAPGDLEEDRPLVEQEAVRGQKPV